MIDAVNEINKENVSCNLFFIGNGPFKEYLEKQCEIGMSNNWIHFFGSSYLEETICKYLYFSDLCVSPGNVGLTAIHSLSFGTPVCTHNNLKKQMPEAQSIIDGYNGFLFEENNLNDLVRGIKGWLVIKKDRTKLRKQCIEIVDKYYNPEYQLKVFNLMLKNKKPDF